MRSNLKKKILILGGSSDISIELYKHLDLEKYDITLHYNKTKPILNLNKNIKLIKKDFAITNQKIKKSFLNKFQNFDIIINLVGYLDNKSYLKSDYNSLLKSLNANFLVPLFIIKKNISYMKKKNFGRIINCSSIGVNFGGGINSYNYSLSKYCSEFIPRHLVELSRSNVLYNNVKLGVIKTKIHDKIINKNLKERIKKIPQKRTGKINEVVKFLIYLINENTFISSQTINFSGGE